MTLRLKAATVLCCLLGTDLIAAGVGYTLFSRYSVYVIMPSCISLMCVIVRNRVAFTARKRSGLDLLRSLMDFLAGYCAAALWQCFRTGVLEGYGALLAYIAGGIIRQALLPALFRAEMRTPPRPCN